MIQTLRKNVHCNKYVNNVIKKTPKLPSQKLGRKPKNNLLPDIPILYNETKSVPDTGQGTVLSFAVGTSDGDAVVDGLREDEVGHRHGTVVGKQFNR